MWDKVGFLSCDMTRKHVFKSDPREGLYLATMRIITDCDSIFLHYKQVWAGGHYEWGSSSRDRVYQKRDTEILVSPIQCCREEPRIITTFPFHSRFQPIYFACKHWRAKTLSLSPTIQENKSDTTESEVLISVACWSFTTDLPVSKSKQFKSQLAALGSSWSICVV